MAGNPRHRLMLVTLEYSANPIEWFRFRLPMDENDRIVQGYPCEGTGQDDERKHWECKLLPSVDEGGISQIDFGASCDSSERYWQTDLRSLTIKSGYRVQMWDHNGIGYFYEITAISPI